MAEDDNRKDPSTIQADGPGSPRRSVDASTNPSLSAAACLSYLCREASLRIGQEEILAEISRESPLDLKAVARCGRRAGLSLEVRTFDAADWPAYPHRP